MRALQEDATIHDYASLNARFVCMILRSIQNPVDKYDIFLTAEQQPLLASLVPICVAMDQSAKSMDQHLASLESDLKKTEAHLRAMEALSSQYNSVILSFAT